MAKYDDLTATDIGMVVQTKLGAAYSCRNPMLQLIHTSKGTEKVFKMLIVTGFDPHAHYIYFVSKISGKDMDDWLDVAITKIRGYTTSSIKELADDEAKIS
jgi:hypothetical protein